DVDGDREPDTDAGDHTHHAEDPARTGQPEPLADRLLLDGAGSDQSEDEREQCWEEDQKQRDGDDAQHERRDGEPGALRLIGRTPGRRRPEPRARWRWRETRRP